MMNIAKYRYFNFLLHTLIWSIVLFLPYLVSTAGNQYKIGPLPALYFLPSGIIHMIIFYANTLLLYPKLLNRAYWWLYIVCVVTLIALSVWVKSVILARWFPDALPEARVHVLFPSLAAFIAGIFYSITVDKINAEKMQQANQAMQLGMELKFLRSQISPHFLFNILTNLVSLARKKSDQLEPSLLMLSGLMRYMLQDGGKKITLRQEAEYLESYVMLQSLRFGRDVQILFNVALPEEETDHGIEPMLLIPFVENAFKHGTGYPDQPFIDIHLAVSEGVLSFRVKNKFDMETDTSKDDISGIGLSNVRSRLSLLYPGRHNLSIHAENHLFSINLSVKLL